jgi:sulfonate transport system permease protein
VERVTYHTEDTGYYVLKVKIRGRSEPVTVTGRVPAVHPGETVRAQGEWVQVAEYGRQFRADHLETEAPSSRDGIERYLGSGLIEGIGPVYARKLVAKFGDTIFDIIEHQSARLEEVPGVGGKRRREIKASWEKQKAVRRIMDPTLQALRAIPSIAWVPLFILWLGIFEASTVALLAVGVFFPVYLGVAAALAGVDRKIIEVGRVFRLSRLGMIRRVTLPAILPAWITALRTGLGLGFMFVVAAEFMGASEGLGYLLVDGQQLGRPDRILAAIIAFAVLGKIADGILVIASRPLLVWQDIGRARL